ncbi:MAG: ribokinase [Verrucomicrobia bacterium]|nr:ribokinase [Verrucomicrobiota bacterium]MCH8510612.1 ribokinase [Kiritimatiellia bacterium]
MKTIFIMGSYVVGVTVRVPRWLLPGETLMGDSFNFSEGGKGTNQAVAAARHGASVRLLAAIGDDVFGRTALALMDREGLSKELLRVLPGEQTGCGIVTVVDGENQIALYAGANLGLGPEDVRAAETVIAGSGIVLAQLEVPMACVVEAFRLGRRHGCLNILNPAPAQPLPTELFPLIDVLTPNGTEARLLLGLPPDDPSPPEVLATRLRDLGVARVVMTLGEDGALRMDERGARRIPSACVNAVDPTGAGDTFNGVLAAGLADGLPLDDAIHRATRAGAYATQCFGTIAAIPTAEQLHNFLKEHP